MSRELDQPAPGRRGQSAAGARNGSTITWTSDNLPASLSASGYTASFNYAPDRSRWRQISTYSGGTETTIYVGGLVEKLTTSTRVHWKHRIPTPSGEVQVIRRSDGTNDVFYVTTDHLGSTDAVTNAAGSVLVRESFAAYGARRGSNWATSTAPDWVGIANSTRRGYTGHEQFDNVMLVHMNGRVYDPAIGRFLSADPYVKSMDAGQGWNRYAYVSNNPLAFTDPSGFADERPPHPLPVLPNEPPPEYPLENIFVTDSPWSNDPSWIWVSLDAREIQRRAEQARANGDGSGAGSGGSSAGGADNTAAPLETVFVEAQRMHDAQDAWPALWGFAGTMSDLERLIAEYDAGRSLGTLGARASYLFSAQTSAPEFDEVTMWALRSALPCSQGLRLRYSGVLRLGWSLVSPLPQLLGTSDPLR